MMSEIHPLKPCPEEAAASPLRYGPLIARIVGTITLISLLVFVIFLSVGRAHLSHSVTAIVESLVFTAAIALPSIFALTWIAYRFTDRFPRLVVLIQAVALVLLATTGCLAGTLILQLLGMVSPYWYWGEFWAAYPFSVVVSLVFGLSISTFETLKYRFQAAQLELRTRQVEQERAYKLLAEARLSSLESRIQPHFLFNTLNSIAALIPSDPQRAEDTVGKLASLLRFSLNAQQSGLVPLAQELKIVHDYLEIEKTRFGARLRYEISVPGSFDDVKLPPLALQTLVENCVKHVVAPRLQGGLIQITGAVVEQGATLTPKAVRLEVIDDGPGFALDSIPADHGLGNLMGRLELLFGGAGQLEVERRAEHTIVSVILPLP